MHTLQKRKPPLPRGQRGFSKRILQRPTLPRGFPRSTIGSGGLNFRVRDGNGCDPSDIATGNSLKAHTKGESSIHADEELCRFSFGPSRDVLVRALGASTLTSNPLLPAMTGASKR